MATVERVYKNRNLENKQRKKNQSWVSKPTEDDFIRHILLPHPPASLSLSLSLSLPLGLSPSLRHTHTHTFPHSCWSVTHAVSLFSVFLSLFILFKYLII